MNIDGVYKVYSGKANRCMCGCAGKWSYTAKGAVDHNPGYQPNVNERSVKIITSKVLNNPDKIVEDGIAYVHQNDRILAVYFSK